LGAEIDGVAWNAGVPYSQRKRSRERVNETILVKDCKLVREVDRAVQKEFAN